MIVPRIKRTMTAVRAMVLISSLFLKSIHDIKETRSLKHYQPTGTSKSTGCLIAFSVALQNFLPILPEQFTI